MNDNFSRGVLGRPQRFEHRVDAGATLFVIVAMHGQSRLVVLVFQFQLGIALNGFPGLAKLSEMFSQCFARVTTASFAAVPRRTHIVLEMIKVQAESICFKKVSARRPRVWGRDGHRLDLHEQSFYEPDRN